MPIDIHAVTVPALLRGIRVLGDVLGKAEAHTKERSITPAALLSARLFPDMFPLNGQVRSACDTAKRAVARLTAAEPPVFENDGLSFEDLQARIQDATAYIARHDSAAFVGAAERIIEMKMGSAAISLTGLEYLTRFSLPNFYFHLTTAYDILRHNGVALGKRDFLGDLASSR
jgi:uncharacterized protein